MQQLQEFHAHRRGEGDIVRRNFETIAAKRGFCRFKPSFKSKLWRPRGEASLAACGEMATDRLRRLNVVAAQTVAVPSLRSLEPLSGSPALHGDDVVGLNSLPFTGFCCKFQLDNVQIYRIHRIA